MGTVVFVCFMSSLFGGGFMKSLQKNYFLKQSTVFKLIFGYHLSVIMPIKYTWKKDSDTKFHHKSMQKPGTELHLKFIPSLNYFPSIF